MPCPEDPSCTQLGKEGFGNKIPKVKLNSMLKNFFLILTITPGGREREITEIEEKENRATQ